MKFQFKPLILLVNFPCLIYRLRSLTNVRKYAVCRFEGLIAVQIEGEWIAVEDAEHALRVLEQEWPEAGGPSHERAVNSCRSSIVAGGPGVGAMSTFAVAAMEAGLPFERHDDYLAFTEARVLSLVETDMREARAEAVT